MIRGPVIDRARMDHTFFSLTNDLNTKVCFIDNAVICIPYRTGSQLGSGAGILPSMSPSSAIDMPGF